MNLLQKSGIFLSAALLAFACGGPSETVETSEAKEVSQASGAIISLDASQSRIGWKGYKPAGQHFGTIPATEGKFILADGQLAGGSFTFDIKGLKIEDLEEGSENYGKLSGHLQSPDFFDTENHPTASFEITNVEVFSSEDQIMDKEEFSSDFTPMSSSSLSPANPTHWISGNLTMRGTSKNIKFPAAVVVENGKVSTKAGFNIDRTEWGISFRDEATVADKAKDQFIYNTVSIDLDVTGN